MYKIALWRICPEKKLAVFFGGVVIAEKVERLVYVCVCVFLFGKVSE